MRFSDIVNLTVGFGALMYPTVHFGTVSKIENTTVQFGGVFRYCKSYGAVRCCLVISCILRWGSVRILEIRNPTVRLGTFSDMVNLTVRFGAVINTTVRFGAVPR